MDITLASTTALPAALAALAGYGLGTSTGAVTFNSLLQSRTPPAARGRVFASFDLLWQLGRLLSLVLGGTTADTLGIQAVYNLGGALLLTRRHRRLARPTPTHRRGRITASPWRHLELTVPLIYIWGQRTRVKASTRTPARRRPSLFLRRRVSVPSH